jgi:hypothetical protein
VVKPAPIGSISDGFYLAGVLTDQFIIPHKPEALIRTLWVILASDLPSIARQTPTHLTVVPSAKGTSQDRFTPYRVTSFREVAERILER